MKGGTKVLSYGTTIVQTFEIVDVTRSDRERSRSLVITVEYLKKKHIRYFFLVRYYTSRLYRKPVRCLNKGRTVRLFRLN